MPLWPPYSAINALSETTHPFAKKSLGQHFLFDPNILQRIARSTGSLEGKSVLEIGPGPGGLTRAILNERPAKLLCVEADARFVSLLADWPEADTGRFDILHADATRCHWPDVIEKYRLEAPITIIANLPYNVGTKLVIAWLKAFNWRGTMSVLLQKEVVDRFCAQPNTSAYGRLSVLSAAVCNRSMPLKLSPGAFRPPPKVDSAVCLFTPLSSGDIFEDVEAMERVCALAFGQRRKMLRKSLQSAFSGTDVTEILTSCDIDPTARPETLNQDKFRVLATAWRRYNGLKNG